MSLNCRAGFKGVSWDWPGPQTSYQQRAGSHQTHHILFFAYDSFLRNHRNGSLASSAAEKVKIAVEKHKQLPLALHTEIA